MSAFGMHVAGDLPLPGADPLRDDGRAPDLLVRSVDRAELEDLVAVPRYMRYLHSYEGCGYAMLEGEDGDVLFHYRERALFHLTSDRQTLRCAVTESGTAWQRVLLDTVLWTVSLLKGFELLHAGAVVTSHGAIALVGGSGAGKTTLATELLGRGGVLFSDDIVALARRGDEAIAHPGPCLMTVPDSVKPWSPDAFEVLSELGDERWIKVHRTPPVPQPIRTLVLLTPGPGAACAPVAPSSLAVLPHMISLPHIADRSRQQFELAGALAAGASLWTLSRPPGADPGLLVDLLLRSLESGAGAAS